MMKTPAHNDIDEKTTELVNDLREQITKTQRRKRTDK